MTGWRSLPISDLVDGFSAGVSVRSRDGLASIPAVLKTSAIRNGGVDLTEVKSILPVDVSRARCELKANSILVSRMNTPSLVGAVGYVARAEPRVYLPDRLWQAGPSLKNKTDMRWLAYTTGFGAVAKAIRGLATGTSDTMKNIPKTRLLELSIPVPPFREQQEIAAALVGADAVLTSIERLIFKCRDVKKALLQQLFDSAIEAEPTKSLDELVVASRPIRYGIVQPGFYDPSGRFMVRGQDYSEAKGWAKPVDLFRVATSVEHKYRNARLSSGDLIMTIVGYVGHVESVPEWLDGANITQTTARISVDPDKASPLYSKYYLQSPLGKSQIAAFVKGAAQPGLNIEDVRKLLIALPQRSEQETIARLLADLDEKIGLLERQLATSRNVKVGMMQELLVEPPRTASATL